MKTGRQFQVCRCKHTHIKTCDIKEGNKTQRNDYDFEITDKTKLTILKYHSEF